MRTRTKGIQLAGVERVVNKQHKGQRIFQRLGAASQGEAETWLRSNRQTSIPSGQTAFYVAMTACGQLLQRST
jgi:hypothetical protein